MKTLGYYLVLESIGLARGLSKPGATKLISQGNEHYRKGELGPAMNSYNKAIDTDPENPIAWNNKGLILTVVGKFDQALECHFRALELDKKYIDAMSNIGMIYSKLMRYDEAMEYYDKALKLRPKHETAWNNKGNLLAKMNKHEDSMKCYKKALEIAPGYVAAMNNMAVAYTHLKDYDRAIETIEKVLEERPMFTEAWYIKGKSYIGMKQFNKAAMCFERAHRLNPDFEKAEKALRVLRQNLQKTAEEPEEKKPKRKPSKREVEKRIETDMAELGEEMDHLEGESDHIAEHLSEEQMLVFDKIGDDPISKTGLKKELGSQMSLPVLEKSLGVLQEKDLIGSETKGRGTFYSRSETLGPIDEELVDDGTDLAKKRGGRGLMNFSQLVNEGKNLAGKNRHEAALKYFKKALKLNPYDDMALLLQAQSFYEVGKTDKAVNSISLVLKDKPDFLPAWITLANLTYEHKEWNDAADCYRKILEIQPDNKDAEKKLAQCEKKIK